LYSALSGTWVKKNKTATRPKVAVLYKKSISSEADRFSTVLLLLLFYYITQFLKCQYQNKKDCSKAI